MVVGPSMLALALLLSPATFAASTALSDLSSANQPGIRRAYWSQIAVFGLVSYSLAAVGPPAVLSMMPEALAMLESTPGAAGALQPWFPLTFGFFAVVSGLAGTLLGRISARSTWVHVRAIRWLVCLALVAVFLLSLLGTTNLIQQHKIPSAWIVILPLAMPLAVTAALAWRDLRDGGRRYFFASRQAESNAVDPDSLDEIVSRMNNTHLAEETVYDGIPATGTDEELTRLVAGIRTAAGPRAKVSPQRAAEIASFALSRQALPQLPASTLISLNLGRLLEFCCAWISLAAGVTLVGLIGGLSPSASSAAIAGFVGAAILARGIRNQVGPVSESARA